VSSGHPFNPPHLVPLVEIVGGGQDFRGDDFSAPLNSYTSIGEAGSSPSQGSTWGMSPTGCRQPWGGRVYHLVAGRGSSVSPMSTRRFVLGDLDCDWGIMGQVLLNHLGGGEGGHRPLFFRSVYGSHDCMVEGTRVAGWLDA